MKDSNPRDFPNIIFDYGGVIINIDVELTISAFQQIMPVNGLNIQQRVESSVIFKQFEKGVIEESEFLQGFNDLFGSNLSWDEFEPAWNAMIRDLPWERVELLGKVSDSHRIFLLSNTNSIHLKKVNEVVKTTIDENSIDHFFEKAYYSNSLGMRKPDTEIYEFVINDQKLDPKETIFLDDNIHNLRSAESVGLAVCHISSENGILEIF